jgi:competence protein ComEA
MRKIRQTCIFIVLFVFLLGGCGEQTGAYLDADASTEQEPVSTQEIPAVTQTDEPILVYVCGEVESPGVYELTGGSRICDAVEAAGGFTDAASREYWNLAEPLSDGEMLYFPTVREAKERQESVAEGTSGTTGLADDGKININTADAAQLMQIPGIGESRAEAILSYRRENGSFSSVEDIMKVSGIKNALFEKMKDYITV